jgi:hypothetical protein
MARSARAQSLRLGRMVVSKVQTSSIHRVNGAALPTLD